MEAELSAKDIKKEVEQHLKDKEKLEQTLPSSIVIGPFFVRVEAVRKKLANKKKALANALLEHLVEKLRIRIEDVSLFFVLFFKSRNHWFVMENIPLCTLPTCLT